MKRQTTSSNSSSSNSNVRMEELQNKDNESKRLRLEADEHRGDGDNDDHEEVNEVAPNEVLNTENAENSAELDPPQTLVDSTQLSASVPSTSGSNVEHQSEQEALKNAQLHVHPLEGHSDIVWSVDVDGDLVISASRDTTVKVWNAEDGTEMCSFRGHTDSVNAIILLSLEQSKLLVTKLKCQETERVAISGSLDCSVRIWSLPEGKELKSIYTYNGITSLDYIDKEFSVIVGTDGGKLEIWDMINGKTVYSTFAHEDAVSCLKVSVPHVYTASVDGSVKVWLLEDSMLQLMYTRHQLKQGAGEPSDTVPRKWKALAASDDVLYLGDNSVTVKMLKWKTGTLKAMWNHTVEGGITEAICSSGDLLLTSAYDISNDSGMVNVWLQPHEYICSLIGGVHRILSIACSQANNNSLRVVTGGSELLVWNCNYSVTPPNDSSQTPYKIVQLKGLEQVSEDNHNDSNASEKFPSPTSRKYSMAKGKKTGNYWLPSWCTLI